MVLRRSRDPPPGLLLGGLLLPGDGPLRPLPRARVRLRALPTNRQPTTVANPPIAPDIGEPLDVRRDLTTEVALDLHRLDHFAQPLLVLGRQILHADVRADPGLREDLLRGRQADPEDRGDSDLDALVAREIDAGDSSHYP